MVVGMFDQVEDLFEVFFVVIVGIGYFVLFGFVVMQEQIQFGGIVFGMQGFEVSQVGQVYGQDQVMVGEIFDVDLVFMQC